MSDSDSSVVQTLRKATNGASAFSSSSDSDDNVPLQARLKAKNGNGTLRAVAKSDSSDSDDDVPLAQKLKRPLSSAKKAPVLAMKRKASAGTVEATDSSSESDVPLAKKIKKPATPSKKAVAKSPATKTTIKKEMANSKATPAKKAKVNKEVAKAEAAQEEGEGDVDEQEYKWWLEQNMDNSVKWKTLSHNGVFFPPEYEPHGVPLVYNGKPVKLVPAVEE
ncbi:DNA topoisomerase 1, partial [Tieghemiomyces parasiticus]